MAPCPPDRKRCPPFLETGAEILRAIDRIEHSHPFRVPGLPGAPAFLADEGQAGQALAQQIGDCRLEESVRRRHRAAIRLPGHIIAEGLKPGERGLDQRPDLGQQGVECQDVTFWRADREPARHSAPPAERTAGQTTSDLAPVPLTVRGRRLSAGSGYPSGPCGSRAGRFPTAWCWYCGGGSFRASRTGGRDPGCPGFRSRP